VQTAVGYGASVIVNDRADLAALSGAGGVHVGQDDLAPAAARALVGAER
jgi:thiamine-phosphate pyrophosphorylase